MSKSSKVGDVRPVFEDCGGFVVVLRRGVPLLEVLNI